MFPENFSYSDSLEKKKKNNQLTNKKAQKWKWQSF